MTFRYCPHCRRGCDNSCYVMHYQSYDCHDVNCPGHHGIIAPQAPRYEMPGGLGPGDWVIADDMETGEDFWYPKDPQKDSIYHQICREYGPLEPGCRYGYDARGRVISFYVSDEAYDFVPPPPGGKNKDRSRADAQRRGSRAQGYRRETYGHERESRSRQHSRRSSRRERFEQSPEPINRNHTRRKSHYREDDVRERRQSTARRPSYSMPNERRQSTARRPSNAIPKMSRQDTGSSHRHRERSYEKEKDLFREARSRRSSFHQDSKSREEKPMSRSEEPTILPDEIEEPLSSDAEDERGYRNAASFESDVNRLSERLRKKL